MARSLCCDERDDRSEDSACNDGSREVDNTAAYDEADVEKAMADDSVGDHSNHHNREQGPVLTELRTPGGERNEKVGYGCTETWPQEREEQIAKLLTFYPTG